MSVPECQAQRPCGAPQTRDQPRNRTASTHSFAGGFTHPYYHTHVQTKVSTSSRGEAHGLVSFMADLGSYSSNRRACHDISSVDNSRIPSSQTGSLVENPEHLLTRRNSIFQRLGFVVNVGQLAQVGTGNHGLSNTNINRRTIIIIIAFEPVHNAWYKERKPDCCNQDILTQIARCSGVPVAL